MHKQPGKTELDAANNKYAVLKAAALAKVTKSEIESCNSNCNIEVCTTTDGVKTCCIGTNCRTVTDTPTNGIPANSCAEVTESNGAIRETCCDANKVCTSK